MFDWWQLLRETSHHVLWVCCCCVQGQHVLLERTEENVRTHVSVVQREGPGSVLFSADGSRGGMREGVRMCVGGTAGVCSSSVCLRVESLSVLAVPRMSAKMTGHAPLFTHSLNYDSLYFCPLFSLHLLCLLSLFFCWIHCNRLHSFHPYLLCTQLYLVQGEWPDNWLILLIVQVSVPSSLWSTNEGRNGQG